MNWKIKNSTGRPITIAPPNMGLSFTLEPDESTQLPGIMDDKARTLMNYIRTFKRYVTVTENGTDAEAVITVPKT